jgi:argininosuccinate synthase
MKTKKLKPRTATFEAQPGEVKKCVLLFSGGLDTSIMLKWIPENYGCEMITVTLDVGQTTKNLKEIKRKALKFGAKKAFVIDVKKEFADEYIAKAIKANALYEGAYPLSTSIARPLQAKWAVKIAEQEKADAVAHGCSGKGNDQVRFDVAITTLNPELKIIAPVREWGMTRDEEIEYAKQNGIPVPTDYENPYSIDENLWGRSIECGVVEYPEKEVPKEVLAWITHSEDAPDQPEYVILEFEKGIPVSLNGKKMELWKLITELNKIAGKHGIGMIDHTEDRVVGLKSREFYECPAATVILKAHKDLEKFVSTIHENHFKPLIDQKWAYMAYAGLWFDPLTRELEAFIDRMNEKVTGTVKLKLFKGTAYIVGRKSKYALYDLNLSTYDKHQVFNQTASPGFIELFGLQTKMAYQVRRDENLG